MCYLVQHQDNSLLQVFNNVIIEGRRKVKGLKFNNPTKRISNFLYNY